MTPTPQDASSTSSSSLWPSLGRASAITAGAAAPVSPADASEAPAGAPARRRRRWSLWTGVAALLLVGGLGAGSYAYASHFEGRALPGTTVAGTDVSGMTREEITTLVSEKTQGTTLTLSGDLSATPSLEELGVSVDAAATADAALAANTGYTAAMKALTSKQAIEPTVSIDDKTFGDYVSSLIPADTAQAVNASVSATPEGGFAVAPAQAGQGVEASVLIPQATQAVRSLSPQTLAVKLTSVEPEVTDAEAQTAADQATALVALDVTVSSPERSFTANAADKASWVSFTQTEDGALSASVETDKVSQWVAERTAIVDTAPVTGKRNVDSDGKVLSTSVEAVNGAVVSNAEAVASAITEALNSSQPYAGSFEIQEVQARWEDRTVASGAENLVYQAAPGEKWVDVNLSAKTVTAYEGATPVHGPVVIVDGAAETPTVTGTYKVYLKYVKQDMGCTPGWDYCTKDVPWVTYFTGSYAFHGAPWRSSFGYSGSHGCLNMPVSEAQWMYNWAEIGTTVVSHW